MKRFATSTLGLVLLTTIAIAQDRQGGARDHRPLTLDSLLVPVLISLLVGLAIGYFLGTRAKKA